MTVNYFIYGDDLKQHGANLGNREPVELEIMSQQDKVWVKASVILFQSPEDDAEPVGLLGPFGQPYDEGKYYIKVLEILPDEESD